MVWGIMTGVFWLAGRGAAGEEPRSGMIARKNVMVPMRDGTKAATDIYLPASAGAVAEGRFRAIIDSRQPHRGVEGFVATADYQVGIESSLRKIFREPDLNAGLEAAWQRKSIKVSACRNEYENFQILIFSATTPLEHVCVEVSDLVDEKHHARIAGGSVNKYVVGYLRTQRPPYMVQHVGFWPDPLFPFAPFSLAAGIVQPIWITVHVPKDAPAGNYSGRIKIHPANGEARELPVRLRVRDFTIPDRSHLMVASDFNTRDDMSAFDKFYPVGEAERVALIKKYLDYLAEHKIHTLIYGYVTCRDEKLLSIRKNEKGAYEYDFSKLDPLLDHIIQKDFSFNIFIPNYNKRVDVMFMINPLLQQYAHLRERVFTSAEFEKTIIELLRSYVAHLREKGCLERALCATWDEAPSTYYAHAKHINEIVKEAAPTLKTVMSADMRRMPEELADSADVWYTHLALWHEESARKLRAKGKEIHGYVSNAPQDRPSLYIDYPAIDPRILFWMSWKYKLNGFGYWNVNAWHYQTVHVQNYSEDKAGKGLTPDTRWNVYHQSPRHACNGDGQLVYPGKDGPIGSIRMELIRDGIEDYEYIWLLNHETEQLRKSADAGDRRAQSLVAESEAVLRTVDSIVKSNKEFEQDPAALLKARERIGDRIEKILAEIPSGRQTGETRT
jgi:hypothetical protein